MQLAIVLMNHDQLPKAEAILDSLRSIEPAVAAGVAAQETANPQVVALKVGEAGKLVVGLVEGEVPEQEAQAAVPFSVSALGTGWTLPPYCAHAVVAFEDHGPGLSPLERLRLFTFLVAAVVEAAERAVGVYWGAARATHEAEFFVRVAQASDMLPVMLWTGLAAARDGQDGLQLLSLAMDQLGLPNLLLRVRVEEERDPLDLFFDLLAVSAVSGRVPPAGEPLVIPGAAGETALAVSRAASPLDPEQTVWSAQMG